MNIDKYNELFNNNTIETNLKINQRELIMKILARYTAKFTVFRELIQNSDDAESTKIEIDIYTNKIIFINNGFKFREIDWERVQTVAYGNTDENTTGCFGVGFYSVFSISDEPIIISGKKGIQFKFFKNELKIKSIENETDKNTTFIFQNLKSEDYKDINIFFEFLSEVIKCTKNITNITLLQNNKILSEITKKNKELYIVDNKKYNYTLDESIIRYNIKDLKIFESTINNSKNEIKFNSICANLDIKYNNDYYINFQKNFSKKLPKSTTLTILFENFF